jgi:hypothetical protein
MRRPQLPLCGDCKRNAEHSTHFHVSLDAAWKSMQRDLGEGQDRIKPIVESRRNLNRVRTFFLLSFFRSSKSITLKKKCHHYFLLVLVIL